MKPLQVNAAQPSSIQLFRTRLDQQVNPEHSLLQLADIIHWQRFDDSFASLYCENNRVNV